MKITIITPAFPYPNRGDLPGIERVAENLAIYFKKLGHNLKIVTTYWNGGKRYDNYKGIPILRVLDSKASVGKIGSIFLLNHITFGLNVIRKKNFSFYKDSDVIILTLAIGFTRFFKIKKLPVFSIFHHFQTPSSIIEFLYIPIYQCLEKRQFKLHKKIVTVSNASKNDIIKNYKIDKKYIKVIPNGVNGKKFNPSNRSEEIREKYGNKILLFASPIFYRKKLPILLKAMTYVIKEIPDVHLIILGNGPLWKYCINLSYSLGINNNTIFLGFVEDNELLKFYASCDLYVFPSEKEGFGQVIIEAMASGTPVICANKVPMSEIIGKGGVTFEVNNSRDLSNKIINLLKNQEILKELGKRALIESKNYQWAHIIKVYIDFIIKSL